MFFAITCIILIYGILYVFSEYSLGDEYDDDGKSSKRFAYFFSLMGSKKYCNDLYVIIIVTCYAT